MMIYSQNQNSVRIYIFSSPDRNSSQKVFSSKKQSKLAVFDHYLYHKQCNMPLAIPESKINRIWTKVDFGILFKDIAKHEHVTVRLVQQINSNLWTYSSPKHPQGCPTKITSEMQEVWTLLFFFFSRKLLTIGTPWIPHGSSIHIHRWTDLLFMGYIWCLGVASSHSTNA